MPKIWHGLEVKDQTELELEIMESVQESYFIRFWDSLVAIANLLRANISGEDFSVLAEVTTVTFPFICNFATIVKAQ